MKPGIYDLPAEEYHADPCDRPSLSASIAHALITQSPLHARTKHPRLNPDFEREESATFEVGTAAHALMLQGDDIITVVHAPDWRTAAAKEARDVARAEGKIPLLADQADRVHAMVDAGRSRLDLHEARPKLFTAGKPEQTIVWEDTRGVLCRSRIDWLHDDHTAIDDYKTTGASADAIRWTRTAYQIGADIQVALYLRGMEKLTGRRPAWRYVVQETFPPYALSVVDLAPSAMALAEAKVEKAIELWAWCVEADAWPAYDTRIASIELPAWEEIRWLERQERAA